MRWYPFHKDEEYPNYLHYSYERLQIKLYPNMDVQISSFP